jgi:subtilisin family serine protease
VKNGPPLADNNDCDGHGTATAGAAAGSTWGVAKKATLYALDVLGCAEPGAATDGLDARRPWTAGISSRWPTAPRRSVSQYTATSNT